mgnify:CR=1 FL=1
MSNHTFKTVAVIGLGYIGLPTAAMFASCKLQVIGIDISPETVDTINRGDIHIVEPDLEMVVRACVKAGHLRASLATEPADAFLIAVPTPIKPGRPEPDLSYIEAASRAIAPVLAPGNLVILESTSPVGTTEKLANWLRAARKDLTFPQTHGENSDIRIAHCPERVLPGKIMRELIANQRIIGGMTPKCAESAASLYKTFVSGDCVIASSPRVAEMAKLAENSFRDVNIAFANELSVICDKLDMDVWELITLANRHPRVNILQPGPGVGGHCIAVDPWFIVASAPDASPLIQAARRVNDSKPDFIFAKIRNAIQTVLDKCTGTSEDEISVACYGLTFKPDIDDLRESPALAITRRLCIEHSGPILIVEPNIEALPEGLPNAKLVNIREALTADIHVMLVDHSDFRRTSRPSGQVIDSRGIWMS